MRSGLYLRGELELITPPPVTIYQWGIPVKILNLESVDPVIPIPIIPFSKPIEVGKLICNPSYGNRETEFKIDAVGWFIQNEYNNMLEYKFMIRDGDTLTELQDWSTSNRLISKLPVPCTIEVQIRSSEQSSILKAKKFIPEEVTIVEEVVAVSYTHLTLPTKA